MQNFSRLWAAAFAVVICLGNCTGTGAAAAAGEAPGTLVASTSSPVVIPGSATASRITYWSVGPRGEPALSTGSVFLPPGHPPRGGWRVIAWAHGTSGLGDDCAPSLIGPTLPARDFGYLSHWIRSGYAIVATDYVGLGTPGVMAYLDGKVEAHSVVDSVKAARAQYPSLSNRWAVIGQSQGGGAAVTTAHHASVFGGDLLNYRGAVATGVPANIELVMQALGPGTPPFALPAGLTSYVFYILAGFREAHPEVDVNTYLTPRGRYWVDAAQTQCAEEFRDSVAGLTLGTMFRQPLSQIPYFFRLLHDYMGIPTRGYDRPLFIGQGLLDTEVPAPSALSLVAQLRANGVPVTLKTYNSDHSGAFIRSLPDASRFIEHIFRQDEPG